MRAKRQTEENASPITDLYRPIRSKRRWLILLALLMVLVGGTVTGAEPVICRLFEYCMEQHGNFVEMEQGKEEKLNEKFEKYELAEIPEGYELVQEEAKYEFGVYQISYVNAEGRSLVLRQSLLENGNLGNITSTREEMAEVEINDFQGYFVEDFDTSSLVLSDGKYMLEIFGSFSKEELLALAKNLKCVK